MKLGVKDVTGEEMRSLEIIIKNLRTPQRSPIAAAA
jgi:hypothetical protein